jgi:hypothetical protein
MGTKAQWAEQRAAERKIDLQLEAEDIARIACTLMNRANDLRDCIRRELPAT